MKLMNHKNDENEVEGEDGGASTDKPGDCGSVRLHHELERRADTSGRADARTREAELTAAACAAVATRRELLRRELTAATHDARRRCSTSAKLPGWRPRRRRRWRPVRGGQGDGGEPREAKLAAREAEPAGWSSSTRQARGADAAALARRRGHGGARARGGRLLARDHGARTRAHRGREERRRSARG